MRIEIDLNPGESITIARGKVSQERRVTVWMRTTRGMLTACSAETVPPGGDSNEVAQRLVDRTRHQSDSGGQ